MTGISCGAAWVAAGIDTVSTPSAYCRGDVLGLGADRQGQHAVEAAVADLGAVLVVLLGPALAVDAQQTVLDGHGDVLVGVDPGQVRAHDATLALLEHLDAHLRLHRHVAEPAHQLAHERGTVTVDGQSGGHICLLHLDGCSPPAHPSRTI